MRLWREGQSGNNPSRRGSDQNGTLINWAVGVVGSAVVLGATLYVQGIAADAKDGLKKSALVSEQQAGMNEAIKRVDEKVDDFRTEQRKTNTEIKDGQRTTNDKLDRLLEMQRRNSR